jgi:hypothetical protein
MIIKINNTVTDRPRVIADALPPIPPPSLPPIALPATDITIRSFFSNWYSPVPVNGYFLDVASDSSFSSFLSGFNNLDVLNVSTYQIPGLDCSVPYYYRVRSYDVPWVPSVNSNIITAITISLEPPVITDATNITPNTFTANWLPSIDASGYYLDVDDDPDFTSPIPPYNDLDIGNVSTYMVIGLAPDTSYYYQLNAYNGACRSNDSSIVHTLRTVPMPLPVALPATNIDFIWFDANWENAPADASGYYLDVATDPDFGLFSFVPGYYNLNVGNVSTYTVIPLFPSTNYYYRIRYYDSYYTSGNSNVIDLTTKFLEAPVATPATDVSVDAFMANWNTVVDAMGYVLYVDDSSDFLTPLLITDVGDVSTYPVIGLIGNTAYYYRLIAYNIYMNSAYSNIIDLVTLVDTYYGCAIYEPYFDASFISTGFLNAGNLVSDISTIGNYLIEWRLNSSIGTTVFISGEGGDPSIQSTHPITNEVVLAGTLYPIIDYAYIDGYKYTSYYEVGSRYSPDFATCLDPVIVQPITCNTSLGTDTLYPYYLNYNNTTDYGLNKSRQLKFNLSASTNYLAFSFDAETVAEQLKIYYCTSTNESGTLLDNFIHGVNYVSSNMNPIDYPNNPIIYWRYQAGTIVRYITNLVDISRNTGDYVKIEIIGSVYEPSNNNTNWHLKLKCFSDIDISCAFADSSISKVNLSIDPCVYYLSDPTCRYDVSYNTLTAPGNPPSRSSASSPFLWKYLDMNYTFANNTGVLSFNNPINIGLRWSSTYTSYTMWSGAITCQNLNTGDTIIVSRETGDVSTYTITCTNVSDYNVFLSNITSIRSSVLYADWLTRDNTNIRYFGYYQLYLPEASTCGDTLISKYLYFHLDSDISWNNTNRTITFPCFIPDNSIIDTSCNYDHEAADGNISIVRNTKNNTNNYAFPYTTKVRALNPVAGIQYRSVLTNERSTESFLAYYINDNMLNDICDLSSKGFMYEVSTASYATTFKNSWVLPRYWDKFSFTSDASTHENRMNNWRLERRGFVRTDNHSDTAWEIVYDMSNGILL